MNPGDILNSLLHFIIGFVCGLVLAHFFNFVFLDMLIWAAVAGLTALIPDVDLPQSKATQILSFILLVLCFFISFNFFKNIIYQIAGGVVLFIIYKLLYHFFKPRHRGITHSFFAVGVVFIISLFVFNWPHLLFIPLGYFSHLLSDGVLKLI
ncbi:metal-dependent hydrolase [Candidatus Micrarchaeota archaeon]|nr:metal-dependent hydrolase [Candidatus Micrarchaeota archaeon]